MRFAVVEQTPNQFVIVPDGQEPLPAVFDTRQLAQEIAERMAASAGAHRERASRAWPAPHWALPS